jgi:hypothetical protein
MTKTKKKVDNNNGLIRPVHFEAAALIVGYYILSNSIFFVSVAHSNFFVYLFVPLIFSLLSSFAFLYLLNHKDFFHFMGSLEKEQNQKEKNLLHKFSRYGALAACMLVNWFGGPIFLALTIRLLIPKTENRYWVAFISTVVPTIFAVAFAKGVFNIIF